MFRKRRENINKVGGMGTEILGLGGPTHQLRGLGCKFYLSPVGTSSPLASTGATDPRTAWSWLQEGDPRQALPPREVRIVRKLGDFYRH